MMRIKIWGAAGLVGFCCAVGCGETSDSENKAASEPVDETGTAAVSAGGTKTSAKPAAVADASGGVSGGTPQATDDIEIVESALVGCRAPDEAGCKACCAPAADGTCTEYSDGTTDWSKFASEPWYVQRGFLEGACPSDCAVCASCSEQDERTLRELGTQDCDCEGLRPILEAGTGGIGADPCSEEGSCACYCSERDYLVARCPLSVD